MGLFGGSKAKAVPAEQIPMQQAAPTLAQIREALIKKITSVIGNGSQITGDMVVCRGIKIDGQIEGDLIVESDEDTIIVIGQTGLVKGNVSGRHVIVLGHVEGSVKATDSAELGESAVLTGDLEYGVLTFHDGAVIEGRLKRANTVTHMPARRFASA